MRGCAIIARPRAHGLGAHHKWARCRGFSGVETQCLGHKGKSSSKLNRSGLNVLVISLYVEIRTSPTHNTPPPHILLPHYISLFIFLFLERHNSIVICICMPYVEADSPRPNPHFFPLGAVTCRLRTTCFASVQFCHILHTPPLRGAVRLGCAPPRGPSCASGSRGCSLRRFRGRPGRVAWVGG